MSDHPALSAAELAFFQRQLNLPELGSRGQRRLKAARVLVVGAGGLGSVVLQELALAGVGFLRICEPDALELHNLHRQPLYDASQVGQPKGRLARLRLQQVNPSLQAQWEPRAFAPAVAGEILAGVDLALDCGDSLALAFHLNDACHRAGIPLVSASVHRWEGQVWSLRPGSAGGCLRCLWPQQPPEPQSCAQSGILGAVTGLVGSWQAVEALRQLLDLPARLDEDLLCVDALESQLRRIRRPRRPECPLCGSAAGSTAATGEPELDLLELEVDGQPPLANWRHALVVDLREVGEVGQSIPQGLEVLHRPLSSLRFPEHGLPADRDLLVVCAHGVRSLWVTTRLRALGLARCWSLRGGMENL